MCWVYGFSGLEKCIIDMKVLSFFHKATDPLVVEALRIFFFSGVAIKKLKLYKI